MIFSVYHCVIIRLTSLLTLLLSIMSKLSESSITVDMTHEKIESVEMDTIESEEIPDILSIILPSNFSSLSIFSFSFNRRVFDGWVKQPSACCGAASVAGIW